MRVTSELWVSALVRRVFSDGGFAAVQRKGSAEAGAIFVIRRTRLGEFELYGPAPQTIYDETKPMDRQFTLVMSTVDEDAVNARIEREARFDSDLWVIELDTDAEAAGYLDIAND